MMDGGIDMTSDISTSLIVVGVDGSAGSREALQWGVAQSELSGAAVQAVMAWQLPEVYSMVSRDYEADARLELQTAIEETLAPDQRSHITSQLIPGRPGHVLVDASRNAQLLVVGSHGHGELIGKFIDSVSAHCVYHASCPVVVVPHSAS
jgi:nucleotide-binding universal stress UspA family protein